MPCGIWLKLPLHSSFLHTGALSRATMSKGYLEETRRMVCFLQKSIGVLLIMLIVPKKLKFLNMQEIGVLDSIPGPIAQELNP